MNYSEAWANGEIEAGTLVDRIEELESVCAAHEKHREAVTNSSANLDTATQRYIESLELELAALKAQRGGVVLPNGWRVMPCTSSAPRDGDRWEVYAPGGSGGVVSAHDVKDQTVWMLLDALASAPNHSEQVRHMVREGWQLVPVEPSVQMERAGTIKAPGFITLRDACDIYKAMLTAAPLAGSQGGDV